MGSSRLSPCANVIRVILVIVNIFFVVSGWAIFHIIFVIFVSPLYIADVISVIRVCKKKTETSLAHQPLLDLGLLRMGLLNLERPKFGEGV